VPPCPSFSPTIAQNSGKKAPGLLSRASSALPVGD
jgi:hypothetical protein